MSSKEEVITKTFEAVYPAAAKALADTLAQLELDEADTTAVFTAITAAIIDLASNAITAAKQADKAFLAVDAEHFTRFICYHLERSLPVSKEMSAALKKTSMIGLINQTAPGGSKLN